MAGRGQAGVRLDTPFFHVNVTADSGDRDQQSEVTGHRHGDKCHRFGVAMANSSVKAA